MTCEPRTYKLTVPKDAEGERLDRWLAEQLDDCSRSYLQHLIRAGHVRINGLPQTKTGAQIRRNDRIDVDRPRPIPARPRPQPIALDILYEDDVLLVLNKPAGLVVHPSPGNREGTLVNALLHHCRGLSSIGGVERPGIVHRLDKLTSGLLVVAKCDSAHRNLAEQLATRKMKRTYIAVVWGRPRPPEGTIRAPIGRHKRDRTKMAVVRKGGREAVTHYRVSACAHGLAVVEVSLETGRTHQIRVHFAQIGRPVVGDEQYGLRGRRLAERLRTLPPPLRNAVSGATRQMLHAFRLQFVHPVSSKPLDFVTPLPGDIERLVLAIRRLAEGPA